MPQTNYVFSHFHFFIGLNSASAFGEQKRLEPMAPDTKARWKKEIDWLLSVTDHIVEFVPSKQKAKDGSTMEVYFSLSFPIFLSLSLSHL